MGTVTDTPRGRIEIGDDVVAQVLGLVALECYGVVGVVPKRMGSGVARLLRRDAPAAGVEVVRDAAGAVAVAVHVVLARGLNIAEVAEALRARIVFEADRLCGVAVGAVDVHVRDVREAV